MTHRGELLAVTGASGFLGTAVVAEGRKDGWRVRPVVRRKVVGSGGGGEVIADVRDRGALRAALDGVDVVVHSAGLAHRFGRQDTGGYQDVNARGTANVMRAALEAGVRHLIHVSSVSVYGDCHSEIVSEETTPTPHDEYALSKMHAEQELVRVVGSSPIRVTILRMATLYGEGDPGNVARLIRAIDKRRFVWIGAGGNRKSLLYRDDAAQACLTVARGESAAGVSTYNVPSIPYPLGQIVGSIEKALGVRVPRWHIPGALALAGAACLSQVPTRRTKALARTARKWLADDVFDGRRFETAFCFRPRVSLDEGILRETRWMRGEEHRDGKR